MISAPAGLVDRVAAVFLRRPDKRNALTPEMLTEFVRAIERAAAGEARALLIGGQGPVFCAGFDLSLCKAAPDGMVMRAMLEGLSRAVMAMRSLPIPVVAAAHGAAIAGGCALLGGADVVVGDRGGKYGYPVVRLGVSPAVSAPWLTAAVGDGHARARMLDPELVDGERAHRLGLVHELVEGTAEVWPRALEIARELAAKPEGGMRATKAWLTEVDGTGDVGRAETALKASLSLAGGAEERSRLAAWIPR